MTTKKFVSVLLSVIMMLSALSVCAVASEDAQLPLYGGVNEETSGSNSFNAQVSGSTASVELDNVGEPTEVGKMLANFWSTENTDGMIIDMNVNGEDLTTFELSLGEDFTDGELLLAVVAYLGEDGTRGFTPLGLVQSEGSVKFDKKTLDHLRIMVIPESLADIESSEQILEAADKFRNIKFIAVYKITPAGELVIEELPAEQWSAFQNVLSEDDELLYMVTSNMYMQEGDEIREIENNSGVSENTISDFYNNTQTADGEIGNVYVLHVSKDGKTVTRISDVERVYDDLIFRTHLLGDFFVVNCPTAAPDADEEPQIPPSPEFQHKLQLDTNGLYGATAALDKYEKLYKKDKIILTVTPGAGREFVQAPVVSGAHADVSEPVKQADGSYIFEITNVAFNHTIKITGEAVRSEDAPINSIKVISPPAKTEYFCGEKTLVTDGLVVEAFYADGESAGIIDNSLLTFDGYNSYKTGVQSITVSYDGFSDTFEINVKFDFIKFIVSLFSSLIDLFRV